jgi:dihydroneopterin aldolase
MNKITLKNMKFFGYHGVFDFEKKQGQIFVVDVEMYCDIDKAMESDNIEDTVDYSQIYGIVKEITQNNRYNLLERLGNVIANEIMKKNSKIFDIIIRIRKPDAPLDGELDFAEVEIRKTK